MKAYKGFDKELKCRNFQFEVGKEYTEEKAEMCKCGFHACLYPLDCFNYYPPADSRYCLVEINNLVENDNQDDTKICGKNIKIIKELSLPELNTAAVDYVLDNIDKKNIKSSTGDRASSSSTGDRASSISTGYRASSSSTGYRASSSVSGIGSVATSIGYQSRAKACLGSAICVVERGDWNGETYPLLAIKAAIVDGEKIKAYTWYKLENGEFVEANDE